jgi:hypothetical protein
MRKCTLVNVAAWCCIAASQTLCACLVAVSAPPTKSSRLADSTSLAKDCAFGDIVSDVQTYDVCRMFLATLQLVGHRSQLPPCRALSPCMECSPSLPPRHLRTLRRATQANEGNLEIRSSSDAGLCTPNEFRLKLLTTRRRMDLGSTP